MATEPARRRSTLEARSRILEAALQVLARDPGAGMGEIAGAAGVVRRTVYGHFPSRRELVHAMVDLAAGELQAALDAARATSGSAPEAWATFVARAWQLAGRFRVLVSLRRDDAYEIHALLQPIDDGIAELVRDGHAAGLFVAYLPAEILGEIVFGLVFSIYDRSVTDPSLSAREAITTTLLTLGVPAATATELAGGSDRTLGWLAPDVRASGRNVPHH